MVLISVTDPNARIFWKGRKLLVDVIRFGLAAVLDFNLVTSISAWGMGPQRDREQGYVVDRTVQSHIS